MTQPPGDDAELDQALDRLAELVLSEEGFAERFVDRPQETVGQYGLAVIPDEALTPLSNVTAQELRMLAGIHQRQRPVVVRTKYGFFF
ncbi:hypothetical protein ACI8AA_12550 [Geodermatophilus sp. SYSU D01180]